MLSFTGYSSHPFRNYFHVKTNSYTAWLGPVGCQYWAYLFLDLRTPLPHPLSVGNPPSPKHWEWWSALLTVSLVYLATGAEDGQAIPRRSFWIFHNCSEEQLKGRFCLGLDIPLNECSWIVTIFTLYYCHPHHLRRNSPTCFNPRSESTIICFGFTVCHDFAMILQQFLQMRKVPF